MKTVKDVSEITGVSIRTLRYYDEIGLLKPTELTEEKVIESVMQSTGSSEEIKQEQKENAKIYKQFMAAKEAGNMDMAHSAVEMLAENYKTMFALDNARNILLDLAKEYLQGEKLAEATDNQFGKGCSEYVAHAIQHYYGA